MNAMLIDNHNGREKGNDEAKGKIDMPVNLKMVTERKFSHLKPNAPTSAAAPGGAR